MSAAALLFLLLAAPPQGPKVPGAKDKDDRPSESVFSAICNKPYLTLDVLEFERPRHVLVVDHSGWMAEPQPPEQPRDPPTGITRMEAQRRYVESIVQYRPDSEIGLVTFSDRILTTIPLALDNRAALLAATAIPSPTGEADHILALDAAVGLLGPQKGTVIFLARSPVRNDAAMALALERLHARGHAIIVDAESRHVSGRAGGGAWLMAAMRLKMMLPFKLGGRMVYAGCHHAPYQPPEIPGDVYTRRANGRMEQVDRDPVFDPKSKRLVFSPQTCHEVRKGAQVIIYECVRVDPKDHPKPPK
jgi:hypothetical protein